MQLLKKQLLDMVRQASEPHHVQGEAKNLMLFFNKRHRPRWCRLPFYELFRQGTVSVHRNWCKEIR